MSGMWICVISPVYLAGWPLFICPSILRGQNFNVEHFMQTFQPDSFTLTILIGTVDLYQFLPLSVTLTVAWDHKKAKPVLVLASLCHTFFN